MISRHWGKLACGRCVAWFGCDCPPPSKRERLLARRKEINAEIDTLEAEKNSIDEQIDAIETEVAA